MAPEHTPAPLAGRAYYGFVLYVSAWTCIVCYLTWALVPHEYLHALGITYLPHKFWALALPSIIVAGVVLFITLVYPGLNLLLAVPPHDIRTLQDSHTLRKDSYDDAAPTGDEPRGQDDIDLTYDHNSSPSERGQGSSSHDGVPGEEHPSCVPPVYDLHISDVCRVLYGEQQ